MLGELGSLVAIGLFVVMMAAVEFGRRIGRRRYQTDKESLTEGLSVAEGAIFALLGLLIAFTFSGAATRFEDRRHLYHRRSQRYRHGLVADRSVARR